MIRAAGIVAVLAGIVLLALLLHATRSIELSATVLDGASPAARERGGQTVHVGVPDSRNPDLLDRLAEAGIGVDTIVEVSGRRERTFWVEVAKEVADAAKPGDTLLIRSKRMGLSLGSGIVQWTLVHYDLGRGAEVRSFNGPENGLFKLVFAGVAAGPLALWGLASGILALARPRRGPSTTPPGSPGTPGSP